MSETKTPKNVKVIATYKSGRQEVVAGKLKTSGEINKTMAKMIVAFRNFPTIESVKIEKW